MADLKTPGVYIVEKNAFPNSVVEVATAVPAFVGYTARHDDKGRDLRLEPRRITSLSEYMQVFGGAPSLEGMYSFEVAPPDADAGLGPTDAVVTLKDGGPRFLHRKANSRHYLFHGLCSFFQNGGGACYIVSIGDYDATLDPDDFEKGITTLLKEQEPTLLVFPDAVLLGHDACMTVQQFAIEHCHDTRSRFAIVDVPRGYLEPSECIPDFRKGTTSENRAYAAAYYPWLETNVVSSADPGLTFKALDGGLDVIEGILKEELIDPRTRRPRQDVVDMLMAEVKAADTPTKVAAAHGGLAASSKTYAEVMNQIRADVNRLPPSATMAGVYTQVDNSRGVWKAPANVGLAGVVRPSVTISDDLQQDLNVGIDGRSVNAIRSFVGQGTLVWGARTLDGNSLDWRYISVRRTLIMLEQSIELATKAYVFAANDASTWATIKSLIDNFLTGIWKRGGLAGPTPATAFSVHVGLGETMTSKDVLEGILRVTVMVAPTRPAEFIQIAFQQKMQKS